MKAISTISNEQIEALLDKIKAQEKSEKVFSAAVSLAVAHIFEHALRWQEGIEQWSDQKVAEIIQRDLKLDFERLWALEHLRETIAMWCEQLPHEVRQALHGIPDIDKTHRCAITAIAAKET